MEGLFGARGIVLAAVVGPASFGVWALFRLALRYGAFAALGIHQGTEVQVAGAKATSPDSANRHFGRATTGYLLVVYLPLGALAVAASFGFGSPARETLWAVAAGLVIERLWVYGSSYLRADGHLRRYAIVELVQASLSLILTVSLALQWGLVGAYLGFLIALASSLLLLARSVPFRPKIAPHSIRRLLRVGVPMSVAAVAATLLATVDRLIVAGFEGTEALGFYAFAVASSGLGASAALAVRTVVFPDVYAHARREGGVQAAENHLRDTVLPVAHLLPPLLGFVALGLGPVVALIAPRYVEVLPVARIFIFTGVASGIMNLGALGLVAAERQRLLPLVTFIGLTFNAFAGAAALLGGLGLAGVATGALVSRSLTGVGIVAITSSGPGISHVARLLVPLLWPLAWCAGVVALIGWLRPGVGLATTGVSVLLYFVALAPLVPKLAQGLGRLDRQGHAG